MDDAEAALVRLKDFPSAVWFVTGHLGRPGTQDDIDVNLEFFYDMRDTMIEIFKVVRASSPASRASGGEGGGTGGGSAQRV